MYEGRICKVVSIAESKSVTFEPLDARPCLHCKHTPRYTLVEESPLFQEKVTPVETISCDAQDAN